jgi:drug/metabolite transporter (DMT)-like permease
MFSTVCALVNSVPLRMAYSVHMKRTTILGFVLVVLGVLALAYQGITYRSRETIVDIGPVHATAERDRTLPLPPVLGIVAVIGGALLVTGSRKRA